MSEKRSSFTGKIGFVLAAAGSAVGLGNIWRFPYLAAKYGGGIFLLVYIALSVTFGFALMIAEIAIGRKTGKSAIEAFGTLDKRFSWLGFLAAAVPIIILPYYSVIGGWVIKYMVGFISGSAGEMAQDSYESLVEKQRHLAECITDKKIRYTYHDAKVSRVEAILARGDRRVGKAIARAVELGANLEAWDEFFDYDRWMQSFADAGLDPDFYTTRGFGEDEILPWDMIDIGVTKAFLLRERKNAYAEKTTPSCAEHCSGGGANKLGGKNRWCK